MDQTTPDAAVARPKTRVARTDGDRRIAYAEYGQPDGTPVVFLHGTPGSHLLGTLLDSAAKARDVRVLAPSRPGYGASSPWPSRSLRDAPDSVLPVLEDANVRRAGLVGFSGGAPHALATASKHPRRVAGVDLVSGATPPDVGAETPLLQRSLAAFAAETPALLRGLFRGQAWVASRLGPSFVVDLYTADETAVPDDVAEVVRADFCEAFARHRSGAVTDLRNAATDWEIDYESITAEIRLWHGRNDANVPIGDARRLARELPDAELRVSESADHLRTLLRTIPDALDVYR